MTDIRRDIRHDSFYAQRQTIATPPVDRPWPLVALAVACVMAIIAGSLGPWIEYERISETAPATWSIPGYQSDGLFSLVFASAALIALAVALIRDGAELYDWVAFGAMALCALIGLAGWVVFAPPELVVPPGGTGTIERVGWGVKVVGVAGSTGALLTFIIAHRLNESDV